MEKAPRKQDDDLTVKFETFNGMFAFSLNGREIYQKSQEECETLFPQYIWWQMKKECYTVFTL